MDSQQIIEMENFFEHLMVKMRADKKAGREDFLARWDADRRADKEEVEAGREEWRVGLEKLGWNESVARRNPLSAV
jgi:hypothetical protein